MSPLRRGSTTIPQGVFPPTIKWLMIANGGVFVLDILLRGWLGIEIVRVFGLTPAWVIERGWVWQPLTYMFVHGGFFHLLFNMFVLWMFGGEIERLWGSAEFLKYYILCGLGAAALSFIGFYHSTVIGASGAVFRILIAFAMLFPNRYIFLWFLIPIKAKYLIGAGRARDPDRDLGWRGRRRASRAHRRDGGRVRVPEVVARGRACRAADDPLAAPPPRGRPGRRRARAPDPGVGDRPHPRQDFRARTQQSDSRGRADP